MTTRAVVAAFDLDGTLTTGDCVQPFLQRLGGRRGIAASLVRRPTTSLVALARRDRDSLKDVVVGGVFRDRPVDVVAEEGRDFAGHVERSMLRDDTLARLRWHQSSGHRTVIVSASLRPYLVPLAAALAVDDVLCTDVAASDGRYLDHLAGPNCRAGEKERRLRAWLTAEGLDDAELWAYGDSSGDRSMLAMAHVGVWVRRTRVLAVPAERGS